MKPFLIISDVKIITFQTVINHSLLWIVCIARSDCSLDYVHTTSDRFEKGAKINKTAFRLHSTGADLFENVTFTAATRARFPNVVERKRSATRRCVNTNDVVF